MHEEVGDDVLRGDKVELEPVKGRVGEDEELWDSALWLGALPDGALLPQSHTAR